MPRDLYEILGVKTTASLDAIKRAYRRLVKRYHPDVNRQRSTKEMFLEVKEAYEVLSNPLLRREYDERIAIRREDFPYRPSTRPRSPRKVRVAQSYVRVTSPFATYQDNIETARDRSMARRRRAANLVWRAYVVTVASMSGTLGVFGGYLLSMGAEFQGGITVGASVMMLALLLIAWLAKGVMAPEL
jgi:curved DNA-binding protein CbpA